MKKLLLAGNWAWNIYEEALARGFRREGWNVIPFNTTNVPGMLDPASLLGRFRLKRHLNPVNDELFSSAIDYNPDLIFLFRCDTILPGTLKKIRSYLPETKIVAYHNDNPYQSVWQKVRCRHFLNILKYVDVAAVYRPDNLQHVLKWGAPRAELLLSSYIRDLHTPRDVPEIFDVMYVGHYENDNRIELINALYESGVSVTIKGTRWTEIKKRYKWLSGKKIEQVWGEEYAKSLSSAKICLAFLSNKNNDVYTRRCFEIPACGSLLMAPRTSMLESLYKDGVEAVFWDSKEDIVAKVRWLLDNEEQRKKIAKAGCSAVQKNGHDEYARARQVISWFEP